MNKTKVTVGHLSKIWCQLNRWQYAPKKFPRGDIRLHFGAMQLIETLVGKTRCLKEWNKRR